MTQEVTKIDDDTFNLVLTDKDLAIFFRVFAQEAPEAMRIAELFGEEAVSFAAMSADNRSQILEGFDQEHKDALFALVLEVETEAMSEIGDS